MKIVVWLAVGGLLASAQTRGQTTAADQDKVVPPLVSMSPVTANQGYATDGTLHYLFSSGEIAAYDSAWQMKWDNKTPFEGMPPGVSHIGDGDVYQGTIYAPVETYQSCDDNINQRIVLYSAKDGSFERYYDFAPYGHETSSVTVVPSTHALYVTSFCEGDTIFQYDLQTMKPLAPLTLSHPITKIQGISWSEQRKQFVVTSDSPAQKIGYVWIVSPEGKVSLLYTVPQTGELEGVDSTQVQIRYLLRHVWSLPAEMGHRVETNDAWTFDIPTTGEISAAQLKSFDKLSNDFAQLERYRKDDVALGAKKPGEHRVIFYGDSITDAWGSPRNESTFFPGKSYLNRGISGQTTAQMLIRFRQDVIDLHPDVVLLLAGTNDIAGNTGPSSLKMIADNVQSMADLAHANGVRMIICSILPADHYRWRPDVKPADSIRQMNEWLKGFAVKRKLVYVDYYDALTDAQGGMKEGLSIDGVHPTPAGYDLMAPLAERGIETAFRRKP